MLTFHLSPIFKARGIEKPYSFLVKSGFTSHTASTILNNETKSLRLDHVELLCKALFCEPNDLLLWTPDTRAAYAPNLPLQKLRQSESDNNWQGTYAAMPYQKLKELTKTIMEKEKNSEE
jgi:DNA-binding Xre family transcriptional regulator